MLLKACIVAILPCISLPVLAHTEASTDGQHLLQAHANVYRQAAQAVEHNLDTENAPDSDAWLKKYGPQIDQPFSGPLSFSHLPYTRCLEDTSATFDIAVLGMPFDTAVTYRSGARFGPYAIRSGSRRQRESRGYTLSWRNNPYSTLR